VGESPRWLFRRGRKEQALAALLRSRIPEQAAIELREMEETAEAAVRDRSGAVGHDSILRRKYVIPFLLACVILACNTATGINSLVGFNTGILLQSGLSDLQAHWGYVIFTTVNFLMTVIGLSLVDRKGRRFLLIIGTSGIIVSLVGVGALFLRTEKHSIDCRSFLQSQVGPDQTFTLRIDPASTAQLLDEFRCNADKHSARSSVFRRHLLLWRLYSFHQLRPFRRPISPDIEHHARELRPGEQSAGFLPESIRQP
jgi:SP family myo-inositol transporter-like MFS transporter 13